MSSFPLTVKNRLWILGREGTFLGEGRIDLLVAIAKFGSISKAAQSMNMSYLKAWKLVDSMNKVSVNKLVIRTSGGKGGGGTTLTKEGKKAIKLYKELDLRCKHFLSSELEDLLNKF